MSYIRIDATSFGRSSGRVPADDRTVSWMCSVDGCFARGSVHDPAFGSPLCAEHHREWRAQQIGWQS